MATVHELRAEARKRHRAAGQKVSRLERNNGVELSGTGIDPRRNLKNIDRYNSRQLRAYIATLNKFTDRSNQYVADAERRPIAASKWQEYKRLENQQNKRVSDRFTTVGDIVLPGGMTIAERQKNLISTFFARRDAAANSPYRTFTRNSTNIASGKKLDKLIQMMKKINSDGYFDSQVKLARDQAAKMLKVLGNDELTKKLDSLTDRQFDIAWHLSPLPNALSMDYMLQVDNVSDNEPRWYSSTQRTEAQEVETYVNWARKL